MRFAASHFFPDISLEAFVTLFFDEPFNEALCAAVHIERSLISRSVSGQRLQRKVLVYPNRAVPKPVQKVLGGQRIGYQEAIDFALPSGAGTFVCTPTVLADRVQTRGTFALAAKRGGVERSVEGEVTVKVFGLGTLIERFIVGDVEKSYADAADFTMDYLKKQGPPRP